MRKYLLAATAVFVISTPAAAEQRDGFYAGIEGGIMWPKSQSGTLTATITQGTQSPRAGTVAPAPGTGLVGAAPATFPSSVTGFERVRYKHGYDVDIIAGYDFGMFRLEAEGAYKRANFRSFSIDPAFVSTVTTTFNPTGSKIGRASCRER